MINVPPWSLVFEQPVHSWWHCVGRFSKGSTLLAEVYPWELGFECLKTYTISILFSLLNDQDVALSVMFQPPCLWLAATLPFHARLLFL